MQDIYSTIFRGTPNHWETLARNHLYTKLIPATNSRLWPWDVTYIGVPRCLPSSYCCIVLAHTLASNRYQVVVTSSIPINTMAIRPKGNIEK